MWVPTQVVHICTLMIQRYASCSDEMIEGLPGDTGNLGDCTLGNTEVDELANFVSFPVQARYTQ